LQESKQENEDLAAFETGSGQRSEQEEETAHTSLRQAAKSHQRLISSFSLSILQGLGKNLRLFINSMRLKGSADEMPLFIEADMEEVAVGLATRSIAR